MDKAWVSGSVGPSNSLGGLTPTVPRPARARADVSSRRPDDGQEVLGLERCAAHQGRPTSRPCRISAAFSGLTEPP